MNSQPDPLRDLGVGLAGGAKEIPVRVECPTGYQSNQQLGKWRVKTEEHA